MEWSFGDVIWTMLVFYLWFMFIWMFISIFGDIFRRDDLSGGAKAGWIILIVLLPFLGILIYMVTRPKMTEQDQRLMMEVSRGNSARRATRRPTRWRSSPSSATRARSPPTSTNHEAAGDVLAGHHPHDGPRSALTSGSSSPSRSVWG